MGWDFTALLRQEASKERLMQGVASLEKDPPRELREVALLWQESGFFPLPGLWQWTSAGAFEKGAGHHEVPHLRACLQTPEGFFLRFGPDLIEVYHPLRW